MFKRIWVFIKRIFSSIWKIIVAKRKQIFTLVLICLILSAAWVGFLFLVGHPPIATTPALIMVWASVVLLVFSIFPKIFDRIKKVKLKDFEIELQETVAQSTPEDYISMVELDEFVSSQKGDFRNLTNLLREARRKPYKPILLVVNLRDGDYISIPMLFIYLFFLDLFGSTITILFINTKNKLSNISELKKDAIIGAVHGKKVIQTFYKQNPGLYRIFDLRHFGPYPMEELFRRGIGRDFPNEDFFRDCYHNLREARNNGSEYLTEEDVMDWFHNQINSKNVEVSISVQDLKIIREAIEQGDDFLLSFKDKYLNSVVSINHFAKNISKKVLRDLEKQKSNDI